MRNSSAAPGPIAAVCEHCAQIQVGFAEVRTKANGFSIFERARRRPVRDFLRGRRARRGRLGQIGIVFESGFDVRLGVGETIHASQSDSVVKLVDCFGARPVIVPDCFGQISFGREKIRQVGMRGCERGRDPQSRAKCRFGKIGLAGLRQNRA